MDRSEIENELREYFSRRADVAAAYLFGSLAREEPGAADVDVAVLFREDPPRTLEGLGLDIDSDLEQRLNLDVDVVVLNRAPVDLVHRVLRDRVLLSENSPSTRIRFEVDARNAYFDLEPILREYRRTKPGGTE